VQVTIPKASIAFIIDPQVHKPLGTGFHFLRSDWIVTAKHVVMDGDKPRPILLSTYLNAIAGTPIDSRALGCQCDVVWTHPEIDLAVLAVPPGAHEVLPLMPGHHSLAGAKGFYFVGYSPTSSGDRKLTMAVGHTSQFAIERRERSTVEETVVFEAATAEGGNSGGPLLGEGGAVVGVIIERFSEAAGKSFCRATSIAPILEALTLAGSSEPVFVPLNMQVAAVPRWKSGRRPRAPDAPGGDEPAPVAG